MDTQLVTLSGSNPWSDHETVRSRVASVLRRRLFQRHEPLTPRTTQTALYRAPRRRASGVHPVLTLPTRRRVTPPTASTSLRDAGQFRPRPVFPPVLSFDPVFRHGCSFQSARSNSTAANSRRLLKYPSLAARNVDDCAGATSRWSTQLPAALTWAASTRRRS